MWVGTVPGRAGGAGFRAAASRDAHRRSPSPGPRQGRGSSPRARPPPPYTPTRQLQPTAGLTAWLLEGSDTRDIPHCSESASQAQSRTEEGREQRGPSTTRGRAGFREGPEAEPEAGIGVTGLDVILGGT